ncbi:hypothetical protein BB561_004416 [Smittium simulii]|uniref:peptidylprolyl isomerase n=1 Tax=Smittium simulii TaxID=133385 RepID=A0A2T9YGH8_9FUNG|nr:hypothetical protein BB561_004416 [Smittium simulii]
MQAQTGDPSCTGKGGECVYSAISANEPRFFPVQLNKLRHKALGTVSMAVSKTLADDSLDSNFPVFGAVVEGLDVLEQLNQVLVDEEDRPFRDIRIKHTIVLDDPFPDPQGLAEPPNSPLPTKEMLATVRLAEDEEILDESELTGEELEKLKRENEARAQALTLEMIGDLPSADVKPPENILFVCKLNPVTRDEDLELIFSRFGTIVSCQIIRDPKTQDSLGYAFIEFDEKKSCEEAYFKMENVLIDDRRIHVDFSQSVSKLHGEWVKGRLSKPGFTGDDQLEATTRYRLHNENNQKYTDMNQSSGFFGSAQPMGNTQTTGMFGSTQPAANTQSTGMFGSTQPAANTQSAGLFGSTQNTGMFGSTQPTANTQSTGLFGSTQPTTNAQSTGLFGSTQPTTNAQSTGLFGSTQPAANTQSAGLFGSAQPAANTQSTGLFGNTQPTANTQNTGLFGSAQPAANTQSTGLFGSTQPTTNTQSTGLFGSTQPTTNAQSTGLFGSTQPAANTQSAGLFGSAQPAANTQSTGLFGSTQPTTNTQSTGLFGSTQPATNTQSTGLFGSTQPAANTQSTGLFGSAQPTTNTQSTGLFGNTQPTANTQNTGLFGSAQPAANTQSTGLFGSTQPTANTQSAGLFGNNQSSLKRQNQNISSLNFSAGSGQTSGLFGVNNSAQTLNAYQPNSTGQISGNLQNGGAAVDEAEMLMQRLLLIKESWDPNSINCQFKHYFYNKVDKSEISRYQCPNNENRSLWEEAQKENPSKENMVPAMVTGFDGLRVRSNYISEQIESYGNILAQIQLNLVNMGGAFDKKSLRLGEIKRKQGNIEQRMLRLNKNLQTLKLYGQLLRPEEEVFKIRVSDLNNALHGNGAIKQQTIRLQNTIERITSRNGLRVINSDARQIERLDNMQYKDITEALEMQSSSLIYMSDSVARLNSEVDSL